MSDNFFILFIKLTIEIVNLINFNIILKYKKYLKQFFFLKL